MCIRDRYTSPKTDFDKNKNEKHNSIKLKLGRQRVQHLNAQTNATVPPGEDCFSGCGPSPPQLIWSSRDEVGWAYSRARPRNVSAAACSSSVATGTRRVKLTHGTHFIVYTNLASLKKLHFMFFHQSAGGLKKKESTRTYVLNPSRTFVSIIILLYYYWGT